MDYKTAINTIIERRNADLARADLYFRELLESDPEFREAELRLRNLEIECAYGRASEQECEAALIERDRIVKERGYADGLNPPPHCPNCGDSGRTEKGICHCVKQLIISTRSDNLDFPLRSFDEFDPLLYPNDKARAIVADAIQKLTTIAAKGEESKRKNVNLIGSTGTGKTFLASCFAGECAASGRTLVFITAFSFLSRALNYHTTFDSNRAEGFTPLLECDVLIIDDLGTESVLKNVTAEYLYLVINERQLKGRTTVITSNLSVDGIALRYGERVASRLFDKKLCYTCEFTFGDIRKISL